MEKWKTFSELCERWNMSKHNLAHLFLTGEMMAYDPDDFWCLYKAHEEYVRESPNREHIHSKSVPPTVDEIVTFLFDIDEVMDYEREKGIIPHVLPTDLSKPILTENLFDVNAPKGLPGEKPTTNTKRAIVLAEATRLRHGDPKMDKVGAKKQIDVILKNKHSLEPYSRTNFNLIIKDLGFPRATRGRKPTNKKK